MSSAQSISSEAGTDIAGAADSSRALKHVTSGKRKADNSDSSNDGSQQNQKKPAPTEAPPVLSCLLDLSQGLMIHLLSFLELSSFLAVRQTCHLIKECSEKRWKSWEEAVTRIDQRSDAPTAKERVLNFWKQQAFSRRMRKLSMTHRYHNFTRRCQGCEDFVGPNLDAFESIHDYEYFIQFTQAVSGSSESTDVWEGFVTPTLQRHRQATYLTFDLSGIYDQGLMNWRGLPEILDLWHDESALFISGWVVAESLGATVTAKKRDSQTMHLVIDTTTATNICWLPACGSLYKDIRMQRIRTDPHARGFPRGALCIETDMLLETASSPVDPGTFLGLRCRVVTFDGG